VTAKHIFFFSDEPLAHDLQAALERAGYAAVGIARVPDGSGAVLLPHNDNAGPLAAQSGEDPEDRRARTLDPRSGEDPEDRRERTLDPRSGEDPEDRRARTLDPRSGEGPEDGRARALDPRSGEGPEDGRARPLEARSGEDPDDGRDRTLEARSGEDPEDGRARPLDPRSGEGPEDRRERTLEARSGEDPDDGRDRTLEPRSGEDPEDGRARMLEPATRRARISRDSELDRRFLLRVGDVIHSATDGRDVLAMVSQELGRHLKVSRCHFIQIDADGDLVRLHNGYQAGVAELPATVPLSAFGPETAVTGARGETLIVDDARSDRRTAAAFDASYGPAAARSVVSVPLMRDRRWVGGLVVASSTPRAWHEREITLVKLVAERAWLWSEHLRALAELKRTEARFDTFVDDVKEYAIFMLDAQGSIATWNAGAERLTGYSSEEAVGRPKSIMHPPGDAGRARAMLDSAVLGGRYEEEGWRVRKDGTRFWASVMITPVLQRDGSLEGFAVVVRDFTDRRRHEDELRLQQAVLVQSRKEREALTQEVDHRVQNNLQVITSLINMQMRKLPPGDARDALARCRNRVLAIAFTQQQLYRAKDYARVRFDHYLRGLVDQILATAAIPFDRIAIEFAIEDVPLGIDRAIPCALVLTELVVNALEHGFVGGRRGTIRVELAAIDGGRLRLAVRDDGVGLPPGFDVRTAQSMGLQLVVTLAEQLDAELAIAGGTGAAFELTFAALAPAD
jgi:PAS domain S-box-containing protein